MMVTKRMVRMGAPAALVLLIAGCSIPFPLQVQQTLDLGGEIEWPRTPEGHLTQPPFEINQDFCALPSMAELQEAAAERFSAGCGRRLEIGSASVKRVRFVALEGDFSSFTSIETIFRVDGDIVVDAMVEEPGGFGAEVELQPDVAEDLGDILKDAKCLQAFVRLDGEAPSETLVFEIKMDIDVRLELRVI